MGYRREPRRIRLVFDDPEMDGLEVVTRSVPLGTFMAMLDSSSDNAKASQLINDFAEHALVEWNLVNEAGEPVPATLTGMKTQEIDFVMQIVRTWLEAVGTASDPLALASSNGSTPD